SASRLAATRTPNRSSETEPPAGVPSLRRRDRAHVAPAEPAHLRFGEYSLGTVRALALLTVAWQISRRPRRDRGSSPCFIGGADRGLHLTPKLERIGDARELLSRAAGARDLDRSVAEHAAGETLVDADSLDLGEHRLQRPPANPAHLDHDSLVGHGE